MNFLTDLNRELDKLHLLKHPFYEAWSCGMLKQSTLQVYAKEYYHHVAAFPRYISAIHSRCNLISDRQILLGNLIEEEQGDNNHPELWTRFAEGLGVSRESLNDSPRYRNTTELVNGFFDLTQTGYSEGLGALYAYERQTPEVSKSKIEGLKKCYHITDERSLAFFSVHQEADEWHSDECAKLIEKLDSASQHRVKEGALKGAQLLWKFLDQMLEVDKAAARAA